MDHVAPTGLEFFYCRHCYKHFAPTELTTLPMTIFFFEPPDTIRSLVSPYQLTAHTGRIHTDR